MEKQPTNNQGFSGILKSYWKLIVGLLLVIAGGESGSIFVIAGIVLIALFFVDIRKKAKEGQANQEQPESPSAPSVGNLFSNPPAKPEDHSEEWVCEKCGATNTGSVCEYCDSPREEKAD